MDQVLKEEKAKLDKVETIITTAAENCKAKGDALAQEISTFVAVDYDDVDIRRDLIRQRKKAAEVQDFLLEIKPSPYFGRLDLDSESGNGYELKSHYIGKHGLIIGNKIIVVDWRAPVGECFYAKNQTSFSIKGIEYSLALRRALNIQDAKLISYQTEYDGGTVSLEGDVIDPFLLTVMRDKRRQNRLTDIIRSIQSNQNDIIRRPLQESFIVQGCAGSGKTMILLHRLSYLKFNHRNMSLSSVKIITPNPDFNAHIDELSTELDIDTIQKYTVEEYYVNLIQRYSRIPNVSPIVTSESHLNPELLGEIYSVGFIAQLQVQYQTHWAAVLEAIQEEQLKKNFALHSIRYPSTNAYNEETATALANGINRIITEYEEATTKYIEAQKRKTALEEEYQKAGELYIQIATEADALRSKMIGSSRQKLGSLKDQIAQINDNIQLSRTRLQEIAGADGGKSEEERRAEEELAAIRQHYQSYINYDRYIEVKDSIASSIADACSDQIIKVSDIERQIQRTPNYSFVKRNALLRQLRDTKAAFTTAVKAYLDTLISEKEAAQSAYNELVQSHREEITALSISIESAESEIKQLRLKESAVDECIQVLTNSGINKTLVLSQEAQNELTDYYQDYEKIENSLNRQARKTAELQKAIVMLEEQCIPPADEDIEYLKACQAEIAKLKYSEIDRRVIRKVLRKAYSDHDEEYTRTNYRHKLYLSLLLCSWYFKRLIHVDTYLNIDEAQDISIAEYTLLRRIMGNECIFNLYGDINQSLFPEKSIMDWEELSEIIGDKVFVLNEDYRNTLQITEYCNTEFGAEIYPIGIRGEEVSVTDAAQAIQWLEQIKAANPAFRTAVITHSDTDEFKETLSQFLHTEEVSWFAVDDRKISILTVENAKGLEFEAVVVLCDNMEINELYIAYTRALDHLCVVKQF